MTMKQWFHIEVVNEISSLDFKRLFMPIVANLVIVRFDQAVQYIWSGSTLIITHKYILIFRNHTYTVYIKLLHIYMTYIGSTPTFLYFDKLYIL